MSARDSGPNWGLAFGSGSFLIVWLLGFTANVSIEVIAIRACVATILGSLVGILVGQVAQGIQALKDDQTKGKKFDFTVPADDAELAGPLGADTDADERTSVVPQAAGVPGPSTNAAEAFQPLDFKQAARQIQNTMKD